MENELMEVNSAQMPVEKERLDVESARAVAQMQGAMAIAKRFPRDESQAMSRIVAAGQRRKLAEAAEYEYRKGGSNVSGPSIRAAEAIQQAWGNIISGITEVKRDGIKKESMMLAYAGDIETNTWKFVEFTVPHTIDTQNGPKALKSGRDIYERTMNDGARRLRNCLLAVIPGDVVETFLEECNKTLSKSDTPLKDRIASMLTAMEAVGVTKAMIENTYQCRTDSISERQLAQLRRQYAGIKDGFGTITDYFKVPQEPVKATDLNEKLKAAKAQEQKTITKPAPQPEPDSFAAFNKTSVGAQ